MEANPIKAFGNSGDGLINIRLRAIAVSMLESVKLLALEANDPAAVELVHQTVIGIMELPGQNATSSIGVP